MTDTFGWPFSDTMPRHPPATVRNLIDPTGEAIPVYADNDTVTLWAVDAPTASQLRHWERTTGRYVSVTLTTRTILDALQEAGTAHRNDTFGDVLGSINAILGDPGAPYPGTIWPKVSHISMRTGTNTLVNYDGSWRPLSGDPWTPVRIASLNTGFGVESGTPTSVDVRATGMRARVITDGQTSTTVLVKPGSSPTLDDVLAPAGISALTRPGPGIVVVGSAVNNGSSSLAWALASHAVGRGTFTGALVGTHQTWSPGNLAPWDATKDTLGAVLPTANSAGPAVILIDNIVDVTDGRAWDAVVAAANSGALCIVTVPISTMAGAGILLRSRRIVEVLRGVIIRSLVPIIGGPAVPIDDTLLMTGDVVRALTGGQDSSLPLTTLRDFYGVSAGTCFDTSLARAVTSGRLRADDGANWVRNTERYASSCGSTDTGPDTPTVASEVSNWQWEKKQPSTTTS